MPHKALFLDRDGVINKDAGYISHPAEVVFTPGIFEFCRRAHDIGYLLIIVTNQSGIGRGLFSERDFHDLMCWMQERFEKEHAHIAEYYFCPHHPEAGRGQYKIECECRKPKPGMILHAAEDWKIDLKSSLLVGDQPRDIEAGRAAGVGRVELFSGVFPSLVA